MKSAGIATTQIVRYPTQSLLNWQQSLGEYRIGSAISVTEL